MKKIVRRAATVAALGSGLIVLGPNAALAHQGHESCAGVPPVVGPGEPQNLPGPNFGNLVVKPIAQAGLVNETVAAAHEAACEPHAPGE